MDKILNRIEAIGILPVLKIENADDAVSIANACIQGGIDAAEVTFRTPCAAQAIANMHQAFPNMLIGAGTIRNVQQAQQAIQAGATFIITPGFNEDVVTWCKEHQVLVIPGVSTASEIEQASQYQLTTLKFFPAQSSGGAQKLKDLASPYANIAFIPTGGIHPGNMHEYLTLPNVLAIGGSFMVKEDDVKNKDWEHITRLCKETITQLLSYELIHIGINHEDHNAAKQTANVLCSLFNFPYYEKPKSYFAGRGFEILHTNGRGKHGHIGIYTPYPLRAMYQLQKQGITFIEDSITRNKKTNRINFVYLDIELAGFGIHLINPDVKM